MGRAEKYANVVKELEKEEEVQEKLSITRELKFGDLQKEIDNSVTIGDYEDIEELMSDPGKHGSSSDLAEALTPKKDEDTLEIVKTPPKKKVTKKVKEEKVEKIIDEPTEELLVKDDSEDQDEDDLLLTKSMNPVKKKTKLRKTFKVLLILLLIVVVGLVLFFKVIKPIYLNVINANPRKVFENSIDYLVDKSTSFLEEYMDDSNGVLYIDTSMKIDSNMEGYDELGSVYYGYKYAVDTNNKRFLEGIYLKNGSSTYEYDYIEDGGVAYRKLSTYDKYMILGSVEDKEEDDSFYSEFAEIIKTESKDDLIYFIKKYAEYTKGSFTDDMFTRKNEEIEVNSKKMKVVCNKLIIDKSIDEKIDKTAKEEAKNDEKFIKLYEKYIGDWEETESDLESTTIINIYTKGFSNKFVGFDIVEDGFRSIYYYKDGDSFVAHFNFTEDEDCKAGRDCVTTNQDIYDFSGVAKDAGTEVTISYNGIERATLLVRSINEEKIDFDYDVLIEEEHYKGDVLLLTDNEKNSIEYNISYRDKDNKYMNLKGNIAYNAVNDIPKIKQDETIELSVKQEDEIFDQFLDSFGSENLENKFLIWYALMTDPTSLFTEEENNTA